MKKSYIYVRGLSEAVEAECLAEASQDTAIQTQLTGITGAKKRYATLRFHGIPMVKIVDDRNIQIPLQHKFALTVKEASELYGISEPELKGYIRNNPDAPFILKAGAKTLIVRKKFEDAWIDSLPEATVQTEEDQPPARFLADLPLWQRPLLTVVEAAKYFQVGESNIRRLTRECRDADFIYWRDLTRVYIRREAFERYLSGINVV